MSVESSWQRIVTWCEANAPRTASVIRPPAGPDAVAAVAAQSPNGWPDDLRRWYALHDGVGLVDDGLYQGLLGRWEVLPLAGVVEHAQMYSDIGIGVEIDGLDAEERDAEAGEPTFTWQDTFVPIGSDGTGCTLFVDTRQGAASVRDGIRARRGCIGRADLAVGRRDVGGPGRRIGVGPTLRRARRQCSRWTPRLGHRLTAARPLTHVPDISRIRRPQPSSPSTGWAFSARR